LQNCFNQSAICSLEIWIFADMRSFERSSSASCFSASSCSILSKIGCRAAAGQTARVSTRRLISAFILSSCFSYAFIRSIPQSFLYWATSSDAIYSIRSGVKTYSTVCSTTYHSIKSFFSFFFLQSRSFLRRLQA